MAKRVHRSSDRVLLGKHDAGKMYLLLNMNYENEMNRIIAFTAYLNVIISNWFPWICSSEAAPAPHFSFSPCSYPCRREKKDEFSRSHFSENWNWCMIIIKYQISGSWFMARVCASAICYLDVYGDRSASGYRYVAVVVFGCAYVIKFCARPVSHDR